MEVPSSCFRTSELEGTFSFPALRYRVGEHVQRPLKRAFSTDSFGHDLFVTH